MSRVCVSIYNVMRGQATHPASMLSGTAKLMNLHELRIQKQETMTNTHTHINKGTLFSQIIYYFLTYMHNTLEYHMHNMCTSYTCIYTNQDILTHQNILTPLYTCLVCIQCTSVATQVFQWRALQPHSMAHTILHVYTCTIAYIYNATCRI